MPLAFLGLRIIALASIVLLPLGAQVGASDAGLSPRRAAWIAERGYVRHAVHGWVRASALEGIAAGFERHDAAWLPPGEMLRVAEGLHPANGHWLPLEDANDHHSIVHRWWKIPSGRYVAFSTCSRATTLRALEWMRYTHNDLVRLFGTEPQLPMTVVLLRNLQQYNAFGVQRPTESQVAPDARGFSAFHYAFPAESWLDLDQGGEPLGAGVAYWDDRTRAGSQWGALAARHAAAHAFVEGIDPSPRAMRAFRTDHTAPFDVEAFLAEKTIPLWLRYGAAVYCERFFVQRGVDRPLWARTWSLEKLREGGALDALETIFALPLDQWQPARSQRLMLQAGAVVAFVLDGEVPAVRTAHARFREAVARDRGVQEAVERLQRVVAAHRKELLTFAGYGQVPRGD